VNNTSKAKEHPPSSKLKGSVLEVLKELLQLNKHEEIIKLFLELVARMEHLELLVSNVRSKKNRSERKEKEKLQAQIDNLKGQGNERLKEVCGQLEQVIKDNQPKDNQPNDNQQPPPKQHRVRPEPQLRQVPNPIAVDEQDKICPSCGTQRHVVGHETQEVVELIPAQVIVRLDQRQILACSVCEGEMVRAPMGDKVVVGGRYGSRLVGKMLVDKYWHGIPLNRIGQDLQMYGLKMPSSTMTDQIKWATDLLSPLYQLLQENVCKANLRHADSTSIPVRDKETKFKITTGALWGYLAGNTAVYLYTSTGKKVGQKPDEVGPEQFLAKHKGYLVTDAGSVFIQILRSKDLIECGCNMHARRYFVKADDAGDHRAAIALSAFQALYRIEESVKEATDEERLQERQAKSKPIYDKLVEWAKTHQPQEPPSSLLGAAIRYLLNHQEALSRFLTDGTIPIDNGAIERIHRRPGMGRNSYLFVGSHEGGKRAAIAYSILTTCNLEQVNPIEYLADILPRLARERMPRPQLQQLLPAAWKQSKQSP
jgi:transposase